VRISRVQNQSSASTSRTDRIARRVVRYYMALRLSVAAAAPELLSATGRQTPAPIVRISPAHAGAWDARECLDAGGRPTVVTVPLTAPGVRHGSAIALN
jgi:hypothetical protein